MNKKEFLSVKQLQNVTGEFRFSIVTKKDKGIDEEGLFKRLQEFISKHSPIYPKINRTKGNHLLVINPADIHIGKYASENETGDEYSSEIAYKRVLDGVNLKAFV